MSKELKIALVQDNPVVGDVIGNVVLATRHIEENKDADLIVFSECFVSGYPVQDLVLRPGFLAQVQRGIDEIRSYVMKTKGPGVLIGAPIAGSVLPYNAALLIETDGSVRAVRKVELPNSDVFDERRVFASASGERPAPLPFRGFNLGVMICEDMWHGDVARSLADELADILIVLNGSPYQRGKHAVRIEHALRRVRTTRLPLIYVNQVGGQDELVFDGGSFFIDDESENAKNPTIYEGADFREDVMRLRMFGKGMVKCHLEYDVNQKPRFYTKNTMLSDYKACVIGLRDYVNKTGAPRVFVGVSGGLDSALVLTMAADAIGAEKVVGVMMPSRHTSQESLDLADDLMTRLGVHKRTLMIEDSFNTISKAVGEIYDGLSADVGVDKPNTGIANENFQARIRGMALMGLSNALGGIVLSTGNKSEMSVGYATLYGDMAGGYNPLKSVYKSYAFEMAEWRNSILHPEDLHFMGAANPIPEGIITRPPTAELAEGQTDEKSLGAYDALDVVLQALIEDRLDAEAAADRLEAKFPEPGNLAKLIGSNDAHAAVDYAKRVARLVRNAQYKRMQAPPGVKINATDFGMGWRYPIAGRYTL